MNVNGHVRDMSECFVMKTVNVRITWRWGAFVQTLLQWKNGRCYVIWMCVCSLLYSARNAQAPYYIDNYGLPGSTYFSTLSRKTFDFREMLLIIECIFRFSVRLLFETFLILRINDHDIIIKLCVGLHVKYLSFLWDFNDTCIFSTYFRKILECII